MNLQGGQKQKKGGNCKGGQNQRDAETCGVRWKMVYLFVCTCVCKSRHRITPKANVVIFLGPELGNLYNVCSFWGTPLPSYHPQKHTSGFPSQAQQVSGGQSQLIIAKV